MVKEGFEEDEEVNDFDAFSEGGGALFIQGEDPRICCFFTTTIVARSIEWPPETEQPPKDWGRPRK